MALKNFDFSPRVPTLKQLSCHSWGHSLRLTLTLLEAPYSWYLCNWIVGQSCLSVRHSYLLYRCLRWFLGLQRGLFNNKLESGKSSEESRYLWHLRGSFLEWTAVVLAPSPNTALQWYCTCVFLLCGRRSPCGRSSLQWWCKVPKQNIEVVLTVPCHS